MSILDRILETKRAEVAAVRGSAGVLERRALDSPAARDFLGAVGHPASIGVISEVKRRSPGAGPIRPDVTPVEAGRAYERGGAIAISVLTDEMYFGGSLHDLSAIRETVSLPVLRKDFVIDPIQVWEARAAGADAVLLIVSALDDGLLVELRERIEELGMAALVEAHDGPELERAIASGARLVGINNRDLTTFDTRLETTLELVAQVPPAVTVVSESGIRTAEDVDRLAQAGVDAVLVGESLLRQPDLEVAVRLLAGRGRSSRTG